MKISARARYGVRLMMVLARNYGKGPIYLKDIAKEEEISEKYLGQIIIPLRGAGLVLSSRGSHGGYMLAREPSEINLETDRRHPRGGLPGAMHQGSLLLFQGDDLCEPGYLDAAGREDIRNAGFGEPCGTQ